MEQYRKKEGNRYYLQELNKKSGELEWKEISLVSSTEPKIDLENNEQILYPPTHTYYFVNEYPDYVTKS
tara:strand:- start:2345 stop:2551 length:207 start_codon:yes stop_codon:yes gene_type:complete